MKLLNNEGDDGPSLKKIFSCENCKFLGNAVFSINKPYKCYHNDIISSHKNTYQIMHGNINSEKITPEYCPFLFKKLRYEKLNEIKNDI